VCLRYWEIGLACLARQRVQRDSWTFSLNMLYVSVPFMSSLQQYLPPSPVKLPSHPPSISKLKALLRRALRVTITDHRIFIGNFVGSDQLLNIILVNTEEYRRGRNGNSTGRYVGQIMIPWKFVVKVEAAVDENQANDSLYF
jgi:small nuclear ribonucleoprotein (snRNP)-like protein